MAGQRLTDKTALAENLAKDDMLMVVDKSDTTGSSAGTSKKVDSKFIMQTDKISIDNATYLALATTPVTLVAAPGSGYAIIPFSVLLLWTQGATANTNATNLVIAFDPSLIKTWQTARNFTRNTTNISHLFTQGSITNLLSASIDNTAFIMQFDAAPTATATGTLEAYVTYQIIKL